MSYSTAIQKITAPDAKRAGCFFIVGRIPATCFDFGRSGSVIYNTEAEALAAILADPWIKANPGQTIQLNDCSVVDRSALRAAALAAA